MLAGKVAVVAGFGDVGKGVSLVHRWLLVPRWRRGRYAWLQALTRDSAPSPSELTVPESS